MHVLVADDMKELANSLAELLVLEIPEATVDVAYDGAEALRMALRKRPAVVILDLEMPGFDGNDVAERLRDIYPVPPRLFALSGNEGRLSALARRNAFVRVFEKPVSVTALVDAIQHP